MISKKNKKIYYSIFFILFLIVFSFAFGDTANALGWKEAVSSIVGYVVSFFIWILGGILVLEMYILIWVASYNDFINSGAVTNGWTIARDLCNMFFILILLIIAFATILKIESYNVKKALPKLIIMAVLINFSKTICGLLIDFAQVIMLTFVNAFKEIGGGNLTEMLGVREILAINADRVTTLDAFSIVGSYLLALIYTIISVVVILVIICVLVMRMVYMWIYIVLSPFAYLLAAFPQGQKYSSQWWSEFSKNVIVGPVLAFFIWLSFVSLGSGVTTESIMGNAVGTTPEARLNQPNAGVTKGGSPDHMLKFIISIGMLLGGLMVAQEIGARSGGAIGKGVAAIQKGQALAVGAAKVPFAVGKAAASFGLDKLSQAVRIDLNVARGYQRFQAGREEEKARRAKLIYKGAVEKAEEGGLGQRLALLSTGDVFWKNAMDVKKWSGMARGAGWRKKKAEEAGKHTKSLQEERSRMMTPEEKKEFDATVSTKEKEIKNIDTEYARQEKEVKAAREYYYRTKDPIAKQVLREKERKFSELGDSKDKVGKEFKIIKLRQGKIKVKTKDEQEQKDAEIRKSEAREGKYKLRETETRLQALASDLEHTEQTKVANVDNAEVLGRMLKEAIVEGNQGLIAAISKKMSRMGDYNEMQKALGLGTGYKGMSQLAQLFERQGKMGQQQSLALLADIGNICKEKKHFGGYGHVEMKEGKLRLVGEKEDGTQDYEMGQERAEISQLAEMLKLEPQEFARYVNRLGLGHYDSGRHDMDTWKPSRAAIKFIQLNAPALETQYKNRGQQNALEHLGAKMDSFRHEITPALAELIEGRARSGGMDYEKMIKSVKRA